MHIYITYMQYIHISAYIYYIYIYYIYTTNVSHILVSSIPYIHKYIYIYIYIY